MLDQSYEDVLGVILLEGQMRVDLPLLVVIFWLRSDVLVRVIRSTGMEATSIEVHVVPRIEYKEHS